MSLCTLLTATFNVSLQLQGDCSDQLTLICRHSDIFSDPNGIHFWTPKGGQLLSTAFPGAMYSIWSNTEHRVTISGVDKVQTLDGGFIIVHCAYNLLKSNAVKYFFIPPGQYMSCIQGIRMCMSLPCMEYFLCPHEHAQGVQPFMYSMHALYVVELALTSPYVGYVVWKEDYFCNIPLYITPVQ